MGVFIQILMRIKIKIGYSLSEANFAALDGLKGLSVINWWRIGYNHKSSGKSPSTLSSIDVLRLCAFPSRTNLFT
jgi:hypothetical protein